MSARPLWIEVLGNLQLRVRGEPVEVPGSRKTRALLGYLLLQDRPVSRAHLCELLWPTPDDPRAALRWSLSKLRTLLDACGPHLRADRTTVELRGLERCVDLRVIESLLARPLDAIPTEELESAAGGFHGELLEGHELSDCFVFYEWLLARRESVRNAQRTLLGELVTRHANDPERALPAARGLLALDPLEESHHTRVVHLLRDLGRYREARRQVDHCRQLLEAELGAAPSTAFLKLADAPPTSHQVVSGNKPARSSTPGKSPSPPHAATPVDAGVAKATPAHPKHAPPESAGLFGRAEECAILEEFLESLGTASPAPVLLLEGEPGIGKTRLLEELERRCTSRAVRVLSGRSWEAEMVRPFAAWGDALAGVPAAEIPADLAGDLAPLLPQLASPTHAPVDEARLFHATGALLEQLRPQAGALVLVFDDVQWMDASSAALLNFVTRRARGALGAVCAGRTGEFADSPAVRALLRSWNRAGTLRRVAVERLADRDAAALARSIRAAPNVDDIVARCGGNPLYVIAMARSSNAEIPEQLQEVLVDRLRALEEPARACAQWVAVVGRETPVAWLEELTAQAPHALVRSMATLQRAGILVLREASCDFAHDLMRQATYGQLPGAQRRLMHRHAARVLEAQDGGDGVLASDVAYHAERGGELQLAARAAVTAGERALRLAAREESYALALRGLRDLTKAAGGGGTGREGGSGTRETLTPSAAASTADLTRDLETRAALLRILVHAGLGRRDVGRLESELKGLARAAHAAGARAAERTAHYLLSIVAEEAGDFDTARTHSLRAERAGRSADDHTRLAALANTARCLVQLERDPRRARQLLGEAETLAAALHETALDIPWGRGLLSALEGDEASARDALEEGARLAHEAHNHWAEYECLAGLSRLDLETGDLDAVLSRDAALREVAGRLGKGSDLPFAIALRELAVAGAATPTAAASPKAASPQHRTDDPLEAALAALRAADTKGRLAYALNVAAEIDLRRGDTGPALERVREAREAAAAVGRPVQMARACAVWGLAELARGNVDAARAQRDQIEADLERLGPNVGARAQWMRLDTALAAQDTGRDGTDRSAKGGGSRAGNSSGSSKRQT